MDEASMRQYREKVRRHLVEEVLWPHALLGLGLAQGLKTTDQQLSGFHARLDAEAAAILQIAGAESGNPAITALLADDAKEIVDDLKAQAERGASFLRSKGVS